MEGVKCLLTFANAWEMIDKATGELRSGLTIEYLMTQNMKPVVNDDGSKGYRHARETLGLDKLSKIKDVPGYYELRFGYKVGSNGKPILKIADLDFVGPVLEELPPFKATKVG